MWESKKIFLRTVELSDLSILLEWENDPNNWEVSDTNQPYTEEEMIQFIVEQASFLRSGQLRLMICTKEKKSRVIGAIDLFDIDVNTKSAGVGILIQNQADRGKGFASEALHLLKLVARKELKLKKLHCSIHTHNPKSVQLFLNSGFKQTHQKSDILYFDFLMDE